MSRSLLDRARAGDVDAFEMLLHESDDAMRALAYRMMRSRDAMDDALQDAYMRAFRSIGGFRGDSKFSTWLHRIVTTTCIDHLRRAGRRRESTLPDEHHGEATLSAGRRYDPAAAAIGGTDLARALERLPVDQRVALILVDAEGYSYDEVADMVGTTPGTVSSRLSRARATLRTLLEVR